MLLFANERHRERQSAEMVVRSIIWRLPVEIIDLIVAEVSRGSDLSSLQLVGPFFPSVTSLLRHSPRITSLASFDILLARLVDDDRLCAERETADDWEAEEERSWSDGVRSIAIRCSPKDHGSKWGHKIWLMMRICERVRRLEVIGVDDFRMKALVSNNQGELSSSSVKRAQKRSLTLIDCKRCSSL